MDAHTARPVKLVLEPIDRVSEILSGVIMFLTVTGSLSVATAGRDSLRTMLIGGLGCNLAWGIIDAVLYLMACRADEQKWLRTFRAVRASDDALEAQRLIAAALPPTVASILGTSELESMRQRLTRLPAPPAHVRLRADDWRGAVGVCLLMFACTFPLVMPFLFMQDGASAARASNVVAIVMLFSSGYVYGRLTQARSWLAGASMVVLGGVLVAITLALGG
jgi:hypothetical protein